MSETARAPQGGSAVLVAGTGGGVGTTTVTALIFEALRDQPRGAPRLLDHTAGELGLRLPEGDQVAALSAEVSLHDLGPHAGGAAVERFARGSVILIVVCPATSAGVVAAGEVLDAIEQRYGGRSLSRAVVVAVGVFGRHRIAPALAGLRDRVGTRSVVLLPPDRALAAGGRIPTIRLSTPTLRGQRQLAQVLRERLGRAAA